jgi:hypothetical protein
MIEIKITLKELESAIRYSSHSEFSLFDSGLNEYLLVDRLNLILSKKQEFVESEGSTPVALQPDTSRAEARAAHDLSKELEIFNTGGEQSQRKLLSALAKAVLAILVRSK